MFLEDLLSEYKPIKRYLHDSEYKATIRLFKKLLAPASFTPRFSTFIIQSGELNAFLYNKKNFILIEWLKNFLDDSPVKSGNFPENVSGYCTDVEIYGGPSVIYEKMDEEDEVGKNNLVDEVIIPGLRNKKRKIRLFYTPERYFIHTFLIGKYLLVSGLHYFLIGPHKYHNYLFDLEDPANEGLYELLRKDLQNSPYEKLLKVKEVKSKAGIFKTFEKRTYTREEYINLKNKYLPPVKASSSRVAPAKPMNTPAGKKAGSRKVVLSMNVAAKKTTKSLKSANV